jgi:indole-3-pyruvate monooxygenase
LRTPSARSGAATAGAAAPDDVLVIGAGPAGLAVAACLRRQDVPYTLVERADSVAASWKRHYDRLHLHTVKRFSQLPFTPWPEGTPRYPSRADVVLYLEHYAREHHIAPRTGTDVQHVARRDDGFTVRTSAGVMTPRVVVVATGDNGEATRPEFPGLATFAGSVVLARDYRNPGPYAGRRTLVVGCGNSGGEIALDLAEHGVDVAMVVRGPVHVVPRELFGRASQETSVLLSRLPVGVRDAIVAPILRLAVGDLSPWGIVRPAVGPGRMIERDGRIPMLDIGTIAHVRAGRIRVVPGVQEVQPHGVRFVDGSTRAVDAIILATGYRPALDRFIEGFGSIADARGRPHRFGEETAIPGLFFVGFRNTPTGALREIALEAPRVATAISRLLSRPA